MNPQTLLNCLLIAAGATTEEEKARIAWRFSDALWNNIGEVPMGFAREFNDLLQSYDWPWVDTLWTRDEVIANLRHRGFSEEMIQKVVPAAKQA